VPKRSASICVLKGFKIGHLNIASLMKHKDELSIFISLQPVDVLCINETRLDSSIYNSEVKIAGYDLIRKNRNRNGGVAIYVRSVIPYINRTELSPDTC
jgi:exonuclease III